MKKLFERWRTTIIWGTINIPIMVGLGVTLAMGWISIGSVSPVILIIGMNVLFISFLFLGLQSAISLDEHVALLEDHRREYDKAVSDLKGTQWRDNFIRELMYAPTVLALGNPLFVMVGLLGTAVGFAEAFQNFSYDVSANGMVEVNVLSTIFTTLSAAIKSSIIGIGMMAWNSVNQIMLNYQTEKFILKVLARR